MTAAAPPPPRPKARRSRLGLALLLVVLFVGVAELGLRFSGTADYRRPVDQLTPALEAELIFQRSEVPGLLYELVPGTESRGPPGIGVPVSINSLGMRDVEPLPPGVAGLSIVALGDSFTFGYGVPAESAWPEQLEQRLNGGSLAEALAAGSVVCEVFNMGVGGYSTRDEALVLHHKALALEPDLIVIGYALNDPEVDALGLLHEYWREAEWWQHSALLRKLAERRHVAEVERLGYGDKIHWGHANPATWNTVLRAFEDIRADAGDVPVLLVVFPVNFGNAWKQYRYRNVHKQVIAAAEAAGFETLDLLPVFGRHDPTYMRVSETDGHPSRAAHRVTAAAIAAWIARRHPELLGR